MGEVTVIILHPDLPAEAGPLTRRLHAARTALAAAQADRFRRAGADRVRTQSAQGSSFGALLARLAGGLPRDAGLVVLGAGSVPRLTLLDARRLCSVAAGRGRRALTNNRYSSDVCGLSEARALRSLPPLPGDNALPRWLAEHGGYEVAELPGRLRLAFDLDSPLDLALLRLLPRPPAALADAATEAAADPLDVPRLGELRALLADPRRELLVAGRASSAGLRALERRAACRVRFLSEERGLRAASPLAQAGPGSGQRPPRSILGRLLEARGGPDRLAATVAELADGAVIDSRVLLADRLGADESAWPSPEDRFASDLLRAKAIGDPWLRALTAAAAGGRSPILLGGHTLVGPGLALLVSARMA
ncbi:MAG: hypothetical protein ACRDGL_07615 [Candidatus Limnocylindrales bacterium]